MSNTARYNAPTPSLIEYYTLATPGLMYQMMPVACLLATIFTLSVLGKNNELVALFSSGMSLARVCTPILTLVMLISSVSFVLYDRLLPVVNQKKSYVYYVEIKKQPGLYSTVKTNRIWYRSGNVLFNIKTLQPDKAEAQGLTMYYFDGAWDLIQMITASRVQIEGTKWNLFNGTVTLFSNETGSPLTQDFTEKSIVVSEETRDLQKGEQGTETLSLGELKRFIQRNKESGLETLRYEVDYYAKFSFGLAAFVMSFIGIPFSVARQRSGGAAINVGITLLLAFGYYAAYSSGITLGRHGALPPILAVSLPNIAMLSISAIFLFRLKR